MKQILKFIVAILFMAIAVNSYAAKNEDITLIVTSDGATKDEAIKNALRNAIEQTYGVFVSANTDILNDEVISDEIATVASGNIKSYKELSTSQSDGKTTVTLEAVVSVGKLISYAKSKDAECELDGAALGRDIELKLLFKKNEEKAVENLLAMIENQLPDCFDYTISMDKVVFSQEEKSWAHGYNIPQWTTTYNDEYVAIPYKVSASLNQTGEQVFRDFFNNLALIGKPEMTDEERMENQMKANKEISKIKSPNPDMFRKDREKYDLKMQEYQNQVMSVYEKYGISMRPEDNSTSEFFGSYIIPAANDNRKIQFRSEKSVQMIKEFLSCEQDCGMNEFLKDFNLSYDNGKVFNKRDGGYDGHFGDSRACEEYVLQLNMSHGWPAFTAGQKFYFFLDIAIMPQAELKKIKTVKLNHN